MEATTATEARVGQPRRRVRVRAMACPLWRYAKGRVFTSYRHGNWPLLAMNIDTEVQRVRHPSLYLEDGDIILAARAESANLVQTFCVHRALLAHYSEVFRDMFVVGAAPSTQDATPEVVLPSDDLASDIATFLGVIYNAPYVQLSSPAAALSSHATSL